MTSESKLYVAEMEKYPDVVSQLFRIAETLGMREGTEVVSVAHGGQGLREELESQFPKMQFILDKPNLRKHLYQTAVAFGFNERTSESMGSFESGPDQPGTCSRSLGQSSDAEYNRIEQPSSPVRRLSYSF